MNKIYIMKKFMLFAFAFLLTTFVSAQSVVVFHENFELPSLGDSLISSADSLGTPTTNFRPWAISTNLFREGLRADTNTLQPNKTIYLTSSSFSTVGNTYVILSFSQICKLFFSDGGFIEVSTDNGVTWITLTPSQYLGTGTMIQNKFSENAYTNWLPGDTLTKPNNTWWKDEQFDISAIAANQTNVKIRFRYFSTGSVSSAGRYGWILDNIKVTASPCELNPPTVNPYALVQGNISTGGPYTISTYAKDYSRIDSVYVQYQVGSAPYVNLRMNKLATPVYPNDSAYSIGIPFPGWGKIVNYRIFAVDSSCANVQGVAPATGNYTFTTVYTGTGLPLDAGVTQITAPSGAGMLVGTPVVVKANLKNFGTHVLRKATFKTLCNGLVYSTIRLDSLVQNAVSLNDTAAIITGLTPGLYTLKVWAEQPNDSLDQNNINDTAYSSFFVCSSLFNGNYTIGGTPGPNNYPTFNAALTGLVSCGVSGPTVFNVAPGTYNEQLVFPAIPGTSAVNTVTFQAANGDSTSVILTNNATTAATNYLVSFSGGQYITFKSMTFSPTNSAYSASVRINANSNLLSFLNNVFVAASASTDTLIRNNTGIASSSLTFMRNYFKGGKVGLSLTGVSTSSLCQNIVIKYNTFYNQATRPAYFQFINALDFGYNYINNDALVTTGDGMYIVNLLNQWKFYNNRFIYASGTRLFSIWSCSGTSGNEAIFANNQLSLSGAGALHMVDFAGGCSYIKFIFNNFNGNSTNATYNLFWLNNANGANSYLYFENNIFKCSGTGVGNLMNVGYANAIPGNNIVFDYNDYFTSKTTFGTINPTTAANFTAWKALTGQDASSLNIDPYFTSNTDLHEANGLLWKAGTSGSNGVFLTNAPVDIDGQSRPDPPCIGSDEFVPPPFDASAQLILSPIGACGLSSAETVKVVLKNVGSAIIPLDSLKVTYGIVNSSGSIVDVIIPETVHKQFAIGDTIQYTFLTKRDMNVTNYHRDSIYTFKAWTILVNDLNAINDSTSMGVASYYLPPAPTYDPVPPIPYGTTGVTVHVHTYGYPVKWFHTPTGGTSFYTDTTYTTGYMYLSDTSYLQTQTGYLLNTIVGTGTNVNTTTTYPTPYGQWYNGSKEQYLILASELVALGVQPGPIQSLGFNLVSAYTGTPMNNYTIKIGSSALSALTTSFVNGLTTVYTSTTPLTPTVGWNQYTFSTPFVWDGVSNIVVENCFDNYPNGYTTNGVVYNSTTSFNSCLYYYSDGGGVCPYATGTTSTLRPNMRLMSTFTGCTSTRSQLALNVMPRPARDPALKAATVPYQGCGMGLTPVTIKIYNIGYDTIKPTSGLQAYYNVNNGANIATENITNLTIKPNDTAYYTFNTQADLSAHVTTMSYKIHAYVQMSNLNDNPNHQNDSVTSASIGSLYTPYPPTVQDITIPFGYPASLTAIINGSDTLWWYSALTGGSLLWGPGSGTGTFQTTYLFGDTTFYAEASKGCHGLRSPLHVHVGPPPQVDASMTGVTSPIGSVNSGVSVPVKARLKNSGLIALTSAQIGWNINGGPITNYSWTGNLAPGTDTNITLTTMNFFPGYYCVKAWSYLPNSIADQIPFNDTTYNCFNACLHGTYTIGDTTGGVQRDFPNFTTAVTTLRAGGVCNNVTFLVDTGLYTEQIKIPKLMGSSSTNTVTFKPAINANNDSTKVRLQYGPSSTANYTVKLDSANYIIFQNMSIITTGSSYGHVVELAHGASYNTFTNNVIQSPSIASSFFAGIYSDSTIMRNNYNTFTNNRILNSYYGIYLYGISSSIKAKGNYISGNDINGFYFGGIYSSYQDSLMIKKNKLTSVVSSGNAYGIYLNYVTNAIEVTKNQLVLNNSGTYNGMYFNNCSSTDPARGFIANNTVSVTGGITSSVSSGLNSVNSSYLNFMANSFNVGVISTSGRTLYVNGGGHLKLFDNNFVNSGGGFAYYMSTATSVDTADYNNIYSTGTNLAYWTSNQTSLSNLKASANGNELHSIALDPVFISPTNLHLASTNLSATGKYLSSVTNDIDGKIRAIIPTIGAVEVSLLHNDFGVISVLFPNPTENENANINVKCIIKNFGLDTKTQIPVHFKINGGLTVYSTTVLDTVPPGTTDIVTFPINQNFIVPAGANTIKAYTSLGGDSNTFNDTVTKAFYGNPLYDAQLVSMQQINGGCNLTTDTVRITIKNNGINQINGGLRAYYQVLGSSFVANEIVPSVINSGSTLTYKFNTPVGLFATAYDSAYTINAWVKLLGDNISFNDSASIVVASLHTPPSPVVSNVTVPYAAPATLTAVSPSNDQNYWYAAQTGTTQLGSGNTYITPYLYNTTTYYVESKSGADVIVGAGTINQSYPFNANYGYSRSASIYQSNEIGRNGLISQLQWQVATSSPTSVPVKIYIKQVSPSTTNLTSQTWANLISGAALVYSGTNTFNSLGWNNINLNVPFTYSSGNLIVLCEANYGSGGSSSYPIFYGSSTTNSTHEFFTQNITPPTSAGTLGNTRPNIRVLLSQPGCTSARVPLIANVNPQPSIDAGVVAITAPSTAVNLTTHEAISVNVKNYGLAPINGGFYIDFQIDNGPIVSELRPNDTILSNATKSITLTHTGDFGLNGVTYNIKAWTVLSNDATALNDSASKTVTNNPPVYCISAATSTAGSDIGNVNFAGINNGVAAPVLGNNMATGTYSNFTSTVAPGVVIPGFTYTMTVSLITTLNTMPTGKCNVYIDYNRNGVWDATDLAGTITFTTASNVMPVQISIPSTASIGLTRMRVVFDQNNIAPACNTYTTGETEDYTLAIIPPITNDAGIPSINTPTKFISYGPLLNISPRVLVRNYGTDSLGSVSVNVNINGINLPSQQFYFNPKVALDTNNLLLNPMPINFGWNNLTVYTSNPNGGIPQDNNFINDTIHLRFFKEYSTSPAYNDDFETNYYWYVPDTSGGTPINNLWAQGTPNKSVINYSHGGSGKAWVTDLTNNYPNSNKSYLYSPAFNISTNAPDSLKFWQWRQLGTGATASIEYMDLNGNWIALGIQNDPNASNWYNVAAGTWTGTSPTWELSTYKLSNLTNLGNILRFRFIFNSGTTGPNLNGWAIDDLSITLAPIPQDGGVLSITDPTTNVLVGDVIYPTVLIKNYGTNTLSNFPLYYKVGNNTPVTDTYTGVPIAPGSTSAPFVFSTPITITPTPSPFTICAFTQVVGDFYTNNDGNCKIITVNPAMKDVGISEIILPDTLVATNSTVKIKVVLRNYGTSTITSVPITYQRNPQPAVTETWTGTLKPVGTPGGLDTIQFTFTSTFVAPAGSSFNVCSWTTLTNDAYSPNDKTCKTIHLCSVPSGAAAISNVSNPGNHNILTAGQNIIFTVNKVNLATSYLWTCTYPGAVITPGLPNDTSVTVTFNSVGSSGAFVLKVSGVNACGVGNPSPSYTLNITVGIEEDALANMWLGQNIPNPTNGLTKIEYYVPLSGEIKFNVVDILGRNVYSRQEKVSTGKHSMDLHLTDLPAGVYYYSLEFKDKRLVNKLILTK